MCPCTLSVHPCMPVCVPMHARSSPSWACPQCLYPPVPGSQPARHCGSGPAWRPLQRPVPDSHPGPSLQLEHSVRLESGELETQEPRGLVRQSVELRRQLQEEQASYRRKLQAYQEGQQRQAQLVQRLQAKVRASPPHLPLSPAAPLGADCCRPPIPRFSSTRPSAQSWSSSCWSGPQSWSGSG